MYNDCAHKVMPFESSSATVLENPFLTVRWSELMNKPGPTPQQNFRQPGRIVIDIVNRVTLNIVSAAACETWFARTHSEDPREWPKRWQILLIPEHKVKWIWLHGTMVCKQQINSICGITPLALLQAGLVDDDCSYRT